ncbi:hypothetical protein HPB51_027195 [Rhipicephalus microplus]|uniref:Uncharacterized protein n=1 Tax=Rhipicephalus microplus TaxID=6941 RepID=A0A9J6D0W0_RHIMP|nr:hypothetical protein HPB51_027195 [Rhipicephalus microplus]
MEKVLVRVVPYEPYTRSEYESTDGFYYIRAPISSHPKCARLGSICVHSRDAAERLFVPSLDGLDGFVFSVDGCFSDEVLRGFAAPPKPREEDEMRFSGLRRDQIPSRSFQTLQKMTGADDQPYQQQQQYYYPQSQQEPPPDIREYCNHPEELDDTTINPRYRGGNIPSRSFKMLQEMTGDDGSVAPSVFDQRRQQQQQQGGSKPRKTTQMTIQLGGPAEECGYSGPQGQGGFVPHPEKVFPNPNVPASQQEAEPDPRKYTGGSIPSRSFRMLQAMTGENTGENALFSAHCFQPERYGCSPHS